MTSGLVAIFHLTWDMMGPISLTISVRTLVPFDLERPNSPW